MSLEFIDGFDHYTSNANMLSKWDTGSTFNQGTCGFTGRFAAYAIKVHWNNTVLTKTLTAVAGRTVGFAAKFGSVSLAFPFLRLLSAGSVQIDLRMNTNGALSVTRNGTVLATSSRTLQVSTWYYIELSAVINSATGSVTVRVTDGTGNNVWLTASGNTSATGTNSTDAIQFAGYGDNSADFYIDDLYVLNANGTVNNGFLGESRIVTALPYADSAANAQWTPNAGTTHYTQVDDADPDGDTTYVSSATAGQIDTYKFASSATFTGAIAGVQHVLDARKDDAGTRTLVSEYRDSAGVNHDGATQFSPTSSYLMYRQIYETDPATGAPWLAAAIGAGEFGAKVIA